MNLRQANRQLCAKLQVIPHPFFPSLVPNRVCDTMMFLSRLSFQPSAGKKPRNSQSRRKLLITALPAAQRWTQRMESRAVELAKQSASVARKSRRAGPIDRRRPPLRVRCLLSSSPSRGVCGDHERSKTPRARFGY